MSKKTYNIILKLLLVFIFLQPIFDILSTFANEGYIFNISKYLKPIFIFAMCFFALLKNPQKKKWIIYGVLFMMFTAIHLLIIYKLVIFNNVILHEFRFMINIIYMVAVYIIFETLYCYTDDKEFLLKKVKNTIFYTVFLYITLYLIAVFTGTSYLTYSFSDSSKFGYRGWFFSGQIFGHAISILFPVLLYTMLKPNRKIIEKILFLLSYILFASLIGTKVIYYITFIVLILYIIICLEIKIFNCEFKRNWLNIILVFFSLVIIVLTFKYTPVYKNNKINNSVSSLDISEYDLNKITIDKKIPDEKEITQKHESDDLSDLRRYLYMVNVSNNNLKKLMMSGKIHPSDNRKKQLVYNGKIYLLSPLKYKFFGIGFLNQIDSSLSIEGDFLMSIFNFGIVGFLLFLSIPILIFIKSIIFIFKNLKRIDLEFYMLFMGLGIFFSISLCVGCTYIYTNFSIFLVVLLLMIKLKQDIISKAKINNNKITFLLLHLGYGGIETSTINTANALCDKYKIELVSFYNLNKNQLNKIDNRIEIKYLYNGSPNKEEFMRAVSKKNIFKILKEGIKAVNILIKKKILIIREIKNTDSKYIVSTRWDFSILLSKYGSSNNIKIAQEHHYHNNDKKYINILKKKYCNIDYLFALTKTLERDYKQFLKKNKHTKVVLVPNMLFEISDKSSDLKNNNIITVSRLDYGKRNDEIIEAFSEINDKKSKLYIIGDGNEFDNLNVLIKKLNLDERVILTGYKDKKEIEKYMLNSSLFLMASETEGLPMVLLEAMNYGIPCIAYETASGVSDIIDDEKNGFVIKNRNRKQYVEKINYTLKNKSKKIEMGQIAKQKVYDFSKDRILNIWLKILGDNNETKKENKKEI